jgi:Yip1 domain
MFRPDEAWAAVRALDPPWYASLLRYALPLSLLPAVAGPLGHGAPFLPTFPVTAVLTLATVLLLALGFYFLAPPFRTSRQWNRSVALAAYASTPVFIAGALLITPVLAIVMVPALIHSFALCHVGLQPMLGCRDSDTPEYVASAFVFAGVGSFLLGGLCSAAGLMEFALR